MDSARIEREAADWLARRDGGDWSEADANAFSEWQSQSTAHRIAIIRIQTIWQKADRLQALGAGVQPGEIPAPGSWRLSPFFDRSPRSPLQAASANESAAVHPDGDGGVAALAAQPTRNTGQPIVFRVGSLRSWAAMLILALVATGAWYLLAYDPNSYRAAIGDIKIVSLADGSTVTLNTDTEIHVTLSPTERRISLDRGEAFFEVAKDPSRPFIVSAAGKQIVAVGTKFSVFREALGTRVVVTEGQVKVEDSHGGPATELLAGSIAHASSAGVLVKHTSVAEAETYTTWRSGYISMHDTELATAAAELNRYNTKQLVVADPSIATLRIGGNLRATNVDAFVRALEEGFPVRAEDRGDRIVLTGKERRH